MGESRQRAHSSDGVTFVAVVNVRGIRIAPAAVAYISPDTRRSSSFDYWEKYPRMCH